MVNKKDVVKSRSSIAFNARLEASVKEKSQGGISAPAADKNALKQRSYRCADDEFKSVNKWAAEMTKLTNRKGRGITAGTIIRALISMKDTIDKDELAEAIKAL
jgi:hypothetical protein